MWLMRRDDPADWRQSVDDRKRLRKSIAAARAKLTRARTETRLKVNEFVRIEDGELEKQAKVVKLGIPVPWYRFWQKQEKVPKELDLGNGSKLDWKSVAENSMNNVIWLAHDQSAAWKEAQKVFWTKSLTAQLSAPPHRNNVPVLRVVAHVPVPPREFLLSQIRADLRGSSDKSIRYIREHYKFGLGRSSIVHIINAAPMALCNARDFCDLVSWGESSDGTIVIAQQSITNCLPVNVVKGCVRAKTHVWGMVVEHAPVQVDKLFAKSESVQGSRVTLVSDVDLAGWMPKAAAASSRKKAAAQYILDCARAILALPREEVDLLLEEHVVDYCNQTCISSMDDTMDRATLLPSYFEQPADKDANAEEATSTSASDAGDPSDEASKDDVEEDGEAEEEAEEDGEDEDEDEDNEAKEEEEDNAEDLSVQADGAASEHGTSVHDEDLQLSVKGAEDGDESEAAEEEADEGEDNAEEEREEDDDDDCDLDETPGEQSEEEAKRSSGGSSPFQFFSKMPIFDVEFIRLPKTDSQEPASGNDPNDPTEDNESNSEDTKSQGSRKSIRSRLSRLSLGSRLSRSSKKSTAA